MKRNILSPAVSLLMSLSVAIGILVADVAGFGVVGGAQAQINETSSPCSNSVPVEGVVGVSEASVSGGQISASGVTVNGVAVDGVFAGNVRVVDSTALGTLTQTDAGGIQTTEADFNPCTGGVIISGEIADGGGVIISGEVADSGGVIISGELTASSNLRICGGVVTGDNVQVVDGVITGENLTVVGAIVTGDGLSISNTVVHVSPFSGN